MVWFFYNISYMRTFEFAVYAFCRNVSHARKQTKTQTDNEKIGTHDKNHYGNMVGFVQRKKKCKEACLGVSETVHVLVQTGGFQDSSGNLMRIGLSLNLGGAQDLVTTWAEGGWVWDIGLRWSDELGGFD